MTTRLIHAVARPSGVLVVATDGFDNPYIVKIDLEDAARQLGIDPDRMLVAGMKENIASQVGIKTWRKHHPKAPRCLVRLSNWEMFYRQRWESSQPIANNSSIWEHTELLLIYAFKDDTRVFVNQVQRAAEETGCPVILRKSTRDVTGMSRGG